MTEQSARNMLPNPPQVSRASPRSRSEHGWSSSTDSPDSNTSSPENTSPATLHSTSLGSDLHIGSLTGLQLSLTPATMPGPPLPPVAGSSQHGISAKSPPMQGQVYRQYANPQQWATENSPQGFSQGSHMHNAGPANNAPQSNLHQMPLESRRWLGGTLMPSRTSTSIQYRIPAAPVAPPIDPTPVSARVTQT
jgi:hypothetical protein